MAPSWTIRCSRPSISCAEIPHDFRRTAVRNLVNAGVPERLAMQMTGHQTRSIFAHYHIVSPGDVERAAGLLDARLTAERERFASGHNLGTIAKFPEASSANLLKRNDGQIDVPHDVPRVCSREGRQLPWTRGHSGVGRSKMSDSSQAISPKMQTRRTERRTLECPAHGGLALGPGS